MGEDPEDLTQYQRWAIDNVIPRCERRQHEAVGFDWFNEDGYLDLIIFYTFIFEVFAKIYANGAGPWNYWCGPERAWNNFDFIIVALSVDQIVSLIFAGGGGGNLMILRLFRLARLLKLVGKIKKLQTIVMGLVAGIQAAGYIAVLLFLVFYIFAIAGMMAFENNDPFHFRTIPNTLLSLFRAATMEDWTDIMYIGMYGCNRYSSGIFYEKDTFTPNQYFSTWDEVPNYFRCHHPKAQPELAAFYWILFIFVSAFVMLSLFVGSITIAMSAQLDNAEADDDAEEEEKAHYDALVPQADKLAMRMKMAWNKYALATGDKLLPIENEPVAYKYGWFSRFAELNKRLSNQAWFQNTVTFTILCAGCTVGMDTEGDYASPNPEVNGNDDIAELNVTLWYADTVINWIFTVEVLVKMLAEDYHTWTYFNDNWNKFDFFIVATSWIPLLLSGVDLGALKLLRLLRLFRILRVLKAFPALIVIVEALLVGMESIGFIALIMFMVYYLFAILGMMMFRENDPWHFGKLHRALLTLFRVATFEDWTDVMYINVYGCNKWGYNDDGWPGPKCNYGPTHGYDQIHWGSVFYFIVFIFLGAFTLLTLFVGVITTSMEEAQGKQANISEGERDITDYFAEYGVPSEAVDDVMECFYSVDTNEDGQVTLVEFMAACKVVTEFNENEFPPKLLLEEAKFCDDRSGEEVPENGNPFILMKYQMNYMARCAGSKATFTYKVDESDEAALAALAAAEEAKKKKEAAAAKGLRKGASKGDLESSF